MTIFGIILEFETENLPIMTVSSPYPPSWSDGIHFFNFVWMNIQLKSLGIFISFWFTYLEFKAVADFNPLTIVPLNMFQRILIFSEAPRGQNALELISNKVVIEN